MKQQLSTVCECTCNELVSTLFRLVTSILFTLWRAGFRLSETSCVLNARTL